MTHYNKLKLGVFISISLLIILSVIFIGYFGLSNIDKANAEFLESSDTMEISFPYTSYDTSLISSNFFGWYSPLSNNTASLTIPTTQTKLPNGNTYAQQGNTTSATYSLQKYTYNGFNYTGLSLSQMFHSNNNYYTYLNYWNLSLTGGETYTLSILLHNYVSGISSTGYKYFEIAYSGSNISYTNVASCTIANVYNNVNSDGYLLYYYTFTPSDTISRIQLKFMVGGIYNFYLCKGDSPIYYDASSDYNIGNIEMSSSSSTTSTTFDMLFSAGSSGATTSGGSISSVTWDNYSLLSYSYIYNQMSLYSQGIFPVVTVYVSSLYIPMFLTFNTYSTDTNLYGNYLLYTGTGYLSSSVTITCRLYVYSSNYWELTLVTPSSGITYSKIYIGWYQNVSMSLVSSTSYQNGYKAAEDYYKSLVSSNYNKGYNTGYAEGLDTAESGTFFNLLSSAIEAPLQAILNIFDFEILGYNMKSFYLSLLTLALVLFCIKFITGNSKNE